MLIAQRVYSLAREQGNSALMIGAYRALACTLYFSGDFESAQQYAMCGLEMWRAGEVQCQVEEVIAPGRCLCYGALSEWHLGEIASCHANLAEAISLAKELNDMHGLAAALQWAAMLGHFECNPAEVERSASDLIELSTRHHFAWWVAIGIMLRGWARSASGETVEGISWMEHGIRDFRASGSMLAVAFFLALKPEALYLADRTSEALEQ